METKNPAFRSRIREYLKRQHFMRLLGFKLEHIEVGRTSGLLQLQPEHFQQTGLVHGGVTATLADIVAGFAAYTLVPATHHVVTAELRVSYLHPSRGPELQAVGWVMKAGEKLNFCESEVWSLQPHGNLLIAKASAVMATVMPS